MLIQSVWSFFKSDTDGHMWAQSLQLQRTDMAKGWLCGSYNKVETIFILRFLWGWRISRIPKLEASSDIVN